MGVEWQGEVVVVGAGGEVRVANPMCLLTRTGSAARDGLALVGSERAHGAVSLHILYAPESEPEPHPAFGPV